jgi:hypothetical protein
MFPSHDCEKEISETAHCLSADQEINKLLTRHARQIKNSERPVRSQCLTSETKASVTSTIPAPTRFTRKTRIVERKQSGILPPPLLDDEEEPPAKFDALYDSVLFQLMESLPLDVDSVKAYISTKDMYLSTASSNEGA